MFGLLYPSKKCPSGKCLTIRGYLLVAIILAVLGYAMYVA